MVLLALFLLYFSLGVSSARASNTTTLHFSFITSFGRLGFNASGVVPAVDLALEQINSRSDLLAGYELRYPILRDSEVHVHIYITRK